MTYFTRIGVWGRFVQQFIMSCMTIPAFIIMKNEYWKFHNVQWLIIIWFIIYGIITLLLTIKVTVMFHVNPDMFGEDINDDQDQNEYLINATTDNEYTKKGTCSSWYFCRSFRMLFIENKMTRYGVINVILVFLLADLLSSYEPLTIAGVDANDDDEHLSNFCGNYLTNLMYQTIWTSLFTAIGAILYIYVLLPFVNTFTFYRYVYPISSIFVAGAIFIISGYDADVSQTWLSLALGFILAFFTYAHQFDDFLNLGYMNKEAVGFYQIVYSWSNNVWKIFGYLFIYLNVLNIAVATMIGILLISSVIQSFFFSKLFIKHKQ